MRPHLTIGRKIDMIEKDRKSMDQRYSNYGIGDLQMPQIIGKLSDFCQVSVDIVCGTVWEAVWDKLVDSHHYLGYQSLLGRRLKYLAFIKHDPVAALSFSAPALKLKSRDRFIGWNEVQKKQYLKHVINNSRFLIFPWVSIDNLASHILAKACARINNDWKRLFAIPIYLIETFVDPRFFRGTCYKAANWKFVGTTYGSSKKGRGYEYHGLAKEVFVYVINPDFRKLIGCTKQSDTFCYRPPPVTRKVEALEMLLKDCQWNTQLTAELSLSEQEIKALAEELISFHQQFHPCFGRIEHHRLGLAYLSGLISNAGAKSVEPIALEMLDEKSVRSLQRFMKDYIWDHDSMLLSHQQQLSQLIVSQDAMINIDSSEFEKKGKESVGVARQYCGRLGKVENCQSGVFIGYSSEKGYGLLNCRLYMPEVWFSQEQQKRCKITCVPEDLKFQTKQQIALDLINQVQKQGFYPARWLGCDATFGSDLNFLDQIPPELYYFAAIRSDTKVFTKKPKVGIPEYSGKGRRPEKEKPLPGQPRARKVSEIGKSSRFYWKKVTIAEGSKGPIVARVSRVRVYLSRDGLPVGGQLWLFMRKNPDGEIKYYISNAPQRIAFSELTKASIMRWPIEQCFKEGKGQLGMDKYEHRSWPAWHRHMIYVFLAMHFLLKMRLNLKKKPLR